MSKKEGQLMELEKLTKKELLLKYRELKKQFEEKESEIHELENTNDWYSKEFEDSRRELEYSLDPFRVLSTNIEIIYDSAKKDADSCTQEWQKKGLWSQLSFEESNYYREREDIFKKIETIYEELPVLVLKLKKVFKL